MFKQSITILLIEDNPGDARLIREMLMEAQSVVFRLKAADRLAKGLDILNQESFDVLLLDLSLPDSNGLETLISVHRHQPMLPIVVLTGYDDEMTGIKAVQEGAQDYLVKGRVDNNLLVRALRYAIERRHAEAQLDWERAKWRAILDGMGEGVIYDEGSSRNRYINQALVRMTGYDTHEFSQGYQGHLDLLRPDSVSEEAMNHLYQQIEYGIQQAGFWRGEMRLCRRDGGTFDASLTCTPVTTFDQRILGTVTIIRDVSQEKVLEEQKSRFVANASHELRTPLTNLQTTLYLARRQPEHVVDHLDTLGYITDRMRGLVEDLLDVSRFERGIIPLNKQLVALQDLLRDVLRVQKPEAARKSITLNADMPDLPLTVLADGRRITQVITNLLVNAINYTPENGTVSLDLAPSGTGQAVITVRDSGVGIAPDMLPYIFQPFFRVNEGIVRGTGLGLTITKEIVEGHGGQIEVQSTVGVGSAFHVWLDLALAAVPG